MVMPKTIPKKNRQPVAPMTVEKVKGSMWSVPPKKTTKETIAIPTALLKKYPRSYQEKNNRFDRGNAATPTKNSTLHH